jgi:hypothetical protein
MPNVTENDIEVINPWNAATWDETLLTVDNASTKLPEISELQEILYQGSSGDEWDGTAVFVAKINDGRYMAYETFWGPTGDGFSEDAYGGDAEVWFGYNFKKLILQALTDAGRQLVGIPKEGL